MRFFVDENHPFMASVLVVIPIQVTHEQVATVASRDLADKLYRMAKNTLDGLLGAEQLTVAVARLHDQWPEPEAFPKNVHEARERGVVLE